MKHQVWSSLWSESYSCERKPEDVEGSDPAAVEWATR